PGFDTRWNGDLELLGFLRLSEREGDRVLAGSHETLFVLTAVLVEQVLGQVQVPVHSSDAGEARLSEVGNRLVAGTGDRDLHRVSSVAPDIPGKQRPLEGILAPEHRGSGGFFPAGKEGATGGRADAEEVRILLLHLWRQLFQGADVVEDVNAPTVGGGQ